MRRVLSFLLRPAAYWLLLPLLVLVQLVVTRGKKELLVWGPVPIINNKYWSRAVSKAGWKSITFVSTYYSAINRRDDFDVYFDDLARWLPPGFLRRLALPLLAHLFVVRRAAVFHIPFSGGPLAETPLWRAEAPLYRMAGVKTIVIPYGADVYRYSTITDACVRHALLLSYPAGGRYEEKNERRVRYWTKHADIILVGYTVEGVGRWEVPVGNMVCIDTEAWKGRSEYSRRDGKNGAVRVVHSPNHRGAKGTEFLLDAVERLRDEGLQVELVLLERVQNEKVRLQLQLVDIAADQFMLPGYGLAAIEAMASGLPVLANLEDESYTRLFRRYSFLNECPILSTSPENLLQNLRLLVRNPELRRDLGRAGRAYAEKYHSYAAAQYLFGAVYAKFAGEQEVDLMNLFHPLKSAYNKSRPRIAHPLLNGRLPADYQRQC